MKTNFDLKDPVELELKKAMVRAESQADPDLCQEIVIALRDYRNNYKIGSSASSLTGQSDQLFPG